MQGPCGKTIFDIVIPSSLWMAAEQLGSGILHHMFSLFLSPYLNCAPSSGILTTSSFEKLSLWQR